MELGTAIASGWASGLNLYATVVLLGVAGRFDWAATPTALQSWWVIGAAAALYAVEFVVDKIPYVDNLWDAVHTVVRPAGAAAVAAMIASGTGGGWRTGGVAAAGALLALSGHSAKATTRLVANASPEPFSNIVLSTAEDGIVASVVVLAMARPALAGGLAMLLALACLVVTVLAWRVAHRTWRALRHRRRRRAG